MYKRQRFIVPSPYVSQESTNKKTSCPCFFSTHISFQYPTPTPGDDQHPSPFFFQNGAFMCIHMAPEYDPDTSFTKHRPQRVLSPKHPYIMETQIILIFLHRGSICYLTEEGEQRRIISICGLSTIRSCCASWTKRLKGMIMYYHVLSCTLVCGCLAFSGMRFGNSN